MTPLCVRLLDVKDASLNICTVLSLTIVYHVIFWQCHFMLLQSHSVAGGCCDLVLPLEIHLNDSGYTL